MSLKDKTIVVTGGSRGLGLGLVKALVAQGGTGVGDEASAAYAGARGIEREAFLAQLGAPLPPRARIAFLVV
jgi:NAD(P)-dependent dehydrogenase (short-subunit alcohol dehydrogenase family)